MPQEILVSQFFLAGLIYSDYADAKLKRGTRLRLVKEPTNPHDQWAIRAYAPPPKGNTWFTAGYVPRDQTRDFHSFAGKVTRAVVHAVEPANATHRRILVKAYGIPASQEERNIIC